MSIVRRVIDKLRNGRGEEPFYMKDNPRYSKYQIGHFSYGKPTVVDYGGTKLIIGKYCSFAEGIKIILGGNHRTDWITTYPFNVLNEKFAYIKGHPHSKGDLVIGNDVWIGTNALILSGLTIGDGAVVAAGCVVTKDVPPYSIIAGNPGRIVRERFDRAEIEFLLRMQWWNLPNEHVESLVPLLQSSNFDKLREEYSKINLLN